MISWCPDKEIITLFDSITFSWYGLMWAVSILLMYCMLLFFIHREKIKHVSASSVVIYTTVSALLGARFIHLLFYDIEYFINHPGVFFLVWEGGLSSHGAILGSTLFFWLYSKKHSSTSFVWMLDRISIMVPLAGACIRVGNFVNAELIGTKTSVPWSVIFYCVDSHPRHPVQLYEAIWLMGCFVLFFMHYTKRNAPVKGLYTGMFLSIVMGGRFFIEFFKAHGHYPIEWIPLGTAQWLSIPCMFAGIYIIVKGRRDQKATILPKDPLPI